MSKRTWIVVVAGVGLCAGLVLTIALWPETEPSRNGEDQREGPPGAPQGPETGLDLDQRPEPTKWLSKSSYVGKDGRMYSTYDTDGDGLYDAEEIRMYGTLMYDPKTRLDARSIEYVALPNSDDQDADALPDDWEQGYFGSLAFGPHDDPDEDGFPNAVEFATRQSPTKIDLMDPKHKPKTFRPTAGTGENFSTATEQFWAKQAEAAERVRSGQPTTRPATPGYVWQPRPVKLGRQLRRTCPARHPWRDLIGRSLRPEEDTDQDGLPDKWEKDTFYHLRETRHRDPDGDGFPNIVELYRGTDPTKVDLLPLSLKPEGLIRVAPGQDAWDIGWDIRSVQFWQRQEELAKRLAGRQP